jgi:hypothetical protein
MKPKQQLLLVSAIFVGVGVVAVLIVVLSKCKKGAKKKETFGHYPGYVGTNQPYYVWPDVGINSSYGPRGTPYQSPESPSWFINSARPDPKYHWPQSLAGNVQRRSLSLWMARDVVFARIHSIARDTQFRCSTDCTTHQPSPSHKFFRFVGQQHRKTTQRRICGYRLEKRGFGSQEGQSTTPKKRKRIHQKWLGRPQHGCV